MSIVKIGGQLVNRLLKEVGSIITTKEEKAQMNMKFTEIVNAHFLSAQKELTERLKIDMQSDSRLAKTIRPLTLIFILLAYTVFSLLDGNLISVNPEYVTLLGKWGETIMYFYFGGRTIEKAIQIFKK